MDPLQTAAAWKVFGAGALGGFISLRHFGELTFFWRATIVFGSGVLADVATPFLIEFYELLGRHQAMTGLLVGLFGMSVFAAIIKAVQTADIWAEIKARLPGGKS